MDSIVGVYVWFDSRASGAEHGVQMNDRCVLELRPDRTYWYSHGSWYQSDGKHVSSGYEETGGCAWVEEAIVLKPAKGRTFMDGTPAETDLRGEVTLGVERQANATLLHVERAAGSRVTAGMTLANPPGARSGSVAGTYSCDPSPDITYTLTLDEGGLQRFALEYRNGPENMKRVISTGTYYTDASCVVFRTQGYWSKKDPALYYDPVGFALSIAYRGTTWSLRGVLPDKLDYEFAKEIRLEKR